MRCTQLTGCSEGDGYQVGWDLEPGLVVLALTLGSRLHSGDTLLPKKGRNTHVLVHQMSS